MDGSKRSHHSNAFFTGFGRFRKIVLFDTLVAQLAEPELESVLAHEIGHYKKRHVVKLLGVSIFGVFMGFAAVAWLARQQWFYRAFGFEYHAGFAAANVVPAMLLFALLAGTISFWFSPLVHIWSRRFEYRGGCLRARDHGRAATAHSSTAQTDREKPEQSDATPALQRFLLLTPDPARTGARAANSRLSHALSALDGTLLFCCHVEQSETSLIISVARYGPNDQRFFASLRMTVTVCRE